MAVQKPIQDEAFRIEKDIDATILLAQEVLGLADAPEKLSELGRLDGEIHTVVTLLEVGPDGQVLNARVGVTGPVKSEKCPATQLFHQAPQAARLRTKLNYSCFAFPPGRTVSEWVSSDDIQWTIMKSNNMKDGSYDTADYKEIGVSPWSCRLVIVPTDESHTAHLTLVAVPQPIAELDSLPGVVTGDGSDAYPVITLGEHRAAMAGVLEQPRHDGLSYYPMVVNRGPPGSLLAAPESGVVRVALRGLWTKNIEANAIIAPDWFASTRGPGEPDQTPVEAEFAWPPIVETENLGSDLEDSGKSIEMG